MKTLTQRRIEIIEDAIFQLKAENYLTGSYGYLKLNEELEDKVFDNKLNNKQAQNYLSSISRDKYCGVCAKGALFLSTVRKENDFKLCDLKDSHTILMNRMTQDNLFEKENLNLIEVYYESYRLGTYLVGGGWVLNYVCYGYYDTSLPGGVSLSEEKAKELCEKHNLEIKKWSEKYPSKSGVRTERLLAIFDNMVKNDGIFKPLEL